MPQVNISPTTTKIKLSDIVDTAFAAISSTRLQSHQSRRIKLLLTTASTSIFVYKDARASASPIKILAVLNDEILFETQKGSYQESMHDIWVKQSGVGLASVVTVIWED